MGGAPQGAMRVALQIWQVVFVSQTLQVFCLAFRKKAQYVVVMMTCMDSHETSPPLHWMIPITFTLLHPVSLIAHSLSSHFTPCLPP